MKMSNSLDAHLVWLKTMHSPGLKISWNKSLNNLFYY